MKYRDLVQFDPIETVIELRDANQMAKAKRLVASYVISESMERQLVDLMAPHLDFGHLEAKGIFVVGNYGTGKSHLMAVVSSIAEHADLLASVRSNGVREAFRGVAGRYLVARFEIGAVKGSLRSIVIRELEKNLKSWRVDYKFPPADQITNNKDAIEQMLAAVEGVQPGKGVLVVIDELLDYLKALGDGAVEAFNFLRELGEASGNGRFRVIAGVQESLISSPTFGFLASLIQKVSARFIEVWITRQDLAFVVESRLLGKTAEQRERIRLHLEQFMPLFPTMSAQRDDFIRLFPVHPRYIQMFEQIEIAEKREVLRTLSQEMGKLLDQDVPSDRPGLIAYDSYWQIVKKTPTLLASPAVGEVEQRSNVVASKVHTSFPKAQYRPAALRIVDALSVYRLAVDDLRAPVGLSATDLRDDLALMLPVPEKDPDFLNTTIESILKDISQTMAGQFVSRNDSGQYYLDLDKVVDYEAKVDTKVSALDPVPEIYDRYYFELLTRILDVNPSSAHVPGMKIWAHELVWPGHNVTRPGYLFFGSPNERSTAQPPRTFYIYFLAHFAPKLFEDARRDDEVFFRLSRPSADVVTRLKRYAAATELTLVSSGDEKAQYQAIADGHRKAVARWFAENMLQGFDVTHAGDTKTLAQAVASPLKVLGTSSPRELVNALGSTRLADSFERRFPGYPRFSGLGAPVTEKSRADTATEGLKFIAGSIQTLQGAAVVEGLGLSEAGRINSSKSAYAEQVRNVLAAKGAGQVVNRDELVVTKDAVELALDGGLEPEWLSVVLLALAYGGEIEIAVPGQVVDASTLSVGASLGAEALGRFRTIQRPKATPVNALRDLFGLLELNPNLLTLNEDEAAKKLQSAVAVEVEAGLSAMKEVEPAQIAGRPLWQPPEAQGLAGQIQTYKDFLDRLRNLNTGGKLKQYKAPPGGLDVYIAARQSLRNVEARLARLRELKELTEYLRDGMLTLAAGDPWQADATHALDSVIPAIGAGNDEVAAAKKILGKAKAAYTARYLEVHSSSRLDFVGDEKKKRIMSSGTMRRLSLLESMPILPAGLAQIKGKLASIVVCSGVDKIEMERASFCPACRFKPALDPALGGAAQQLDASETGLDKLNEEWSAFLIKALDDPTAKESLALLDASRMKAVREATKATVVPDASAIQDLNRVLQGLEKVVIGGDTLLAALRHGGPATVEDVTKRFQDAVAEATRAKTPAKVRIVIE